MDVLLGELVRVVLHVFLGVFVGRDELEAEATKLELPSDAEVLLLVVGLAHRVLVVLALHELATDAARVLVAHLVHLGGVVTAVERDDELTVLVIGLGGDELGVEAEDVHVLLEHFLHVNLGGLGLKVKYGGHGILVSTEARVGGDRLVLNGRGSSGELDGHLSYS